MADGSAGVGIGFNTTKHFLENLQARQNEIAEIAIRAGIGISCPAGTNNALALLSMGAERQALKQT